MAGDWIKVDHALPDKPEIDVIACALDIDHNAALGMVVRFWIWVDRQSVDGNALSVTEKFIDRIAECAGFAEALMSAGWLFKKRGVFSIPNFERHNGKSAKARALTKNRVGKNRNGASVTQSLPEKRREEKSKESPNGDSSPKPPKGDKSGKVTLPENLRTPEFKAAWIDWVSHRREIKKPLKATQAAKQMKKFSEWGAERSIRAINFTIEKGWQGLKEPDDDRTNQRPGPPRPNGSHGGATPVQREADRMQQQLGVLADYAAEDEPGGIRGDDGPSLCHEANGGAG